MNNKTKVGLIFISLGFFFLAAVFFFVSTKEFQKKFLHLPDESAIGEIMVGGLSVDDAVLSVQTFYQNTFITLDYAGSIIQVNPAEFGISIDSAPIQSTIIQALNAQNTRYAYFCSLFAPFATVAITVPLEIYTDEQKIRTFLNSQIAPRYDRIAFASQPNPTGFGFTEGRTGRELNIEESIALIKAALRSHTIRSVTLPVQTIPQPNAEIFNLEIQLKYITDHYQEKGQITEIFVFDPAKDQSVLVSRKDNGDIPGEIAFTAASTIKLPIMISSFKIIDAEPSAETRRMLTLMITESKNDQTDWLMENIIGGNLAPFSVTNDIRALGYENTFLAGYFYLGAPLLDNIRTVANSRQDFDLNPDRYNQTTAKDMGGIMRDVYQCAKDATGSLIKTFNNQVTQKECAEMIELLKNNRLPYLISAGIPDGTPIAHKHGWIEESDGLLHSMSNVATVYSEGADYILSIFTYHPENLIFEDGNKLFSMISATVYSFFNPERHE